jgi:hypothetical protein
MGIPEWFESDETTVLTRILEHYRDGTLALVLTVHRGNMDDGRISYESNRQSNL